MERTGFGIDIGGSGMKAAIVDLESGALIADRYRINTPQPATPEAMATVVTELVDHFEWQGPVGIALPSVVRHGVVHSAANIDASWIDVDAAVLFGSVLGAPPHVLNDADAAGLAEMSFGAGRGRNGVVLVLTFGTGIGSGLFINGRLVPNTELGHLEYHGDSIEKWAAASAKQREKLSWRKWAERVNVYLEIVDKLFSPDLVIMGGGASKSSEKWLSRIESRCEIAIAEFANSAGIIGAAMAAQSSDIAR